MHIIRQLSPIHRNQQNQTNIRTPRFVNIYVKFEHRGRKEHFSA